MSNILSLVQTKCDKHGQPKQFICIEQYCNQESQVICKKCAADHQHHLIVTCQQGIKMSQDYIQMKKKVYEDLTTITSNIQNLKQNVLKEIEFIELKAKNTLQQLKLKQPIEQTIERYLQQKNEQSLTELEYQFIAQYLCQVAKKERKEAQLDIEFRIYFESAQYLEQLLQNVQQKLQILNPQKNLQHADSKLQVNQFIKLLQNEILTIKTNDMIVTPIQVLRNCKILGYMQPCINGIDQLKDQEMLFSVHLGRNLDEFLYQQRIFLNHNAQNIINDQYHIKISPIALTANQEYTLSLQVKGKLHLYQFYKKAAENPYILFQQKQERDFQKYSNEIELIVNHGQFPMLILQSEAEKK